MLNLGLGLGIGGNGAAAISLDTVADPYLAFLMTTSSTGAASPTYPATIVSGDVGLLMVNSANVSIATPTGFTAPSSNYQGTGTPNDAAAVGLQVFYRVYDGSETPGGTITVADSGDHTIVALATYRGVKAVAGNPIESIAGSVVTPASTSITFNTTTTAVDNSMVLMIAAHEVASSSDTITIASNPDLTLLTRDVAFNTAIGFGGGITVTSGIDRASGAVGAGTATTTSTLQALMTIVMQPELQPTAPYIYDIGTYAAGIGNITPGLPAHAADDVLLLVAESNTGEAVSHVDYTAVSSSPQDASTGTLPNRLTALVRRAGGSESAPIITDPGDHCSAIILSIRGCPTGGAVASTIDVETGNTEVTATTAVTIPSVTTTVGNCLVVNIVSHGEDTASSNRISAWANSNLTFFRERSDKNTNSLGGGGFGIASGWKDVAGATGSTTATLAAISVQGRITLAFKPA